jgi:predicted lactoylglutathione lyase
LDIIASDVIKLGRLQAVKFHKDTLIRWRKEYYVDSNEDFIGDENAIDALLKDVSRVFNIEVKHILSKTRQREVVTLRRIVMFIATTYKFGSLSKIGQKLGGRDHTTVIHSNQMFRDLYDNSDNHLLTHWNHYLLNGIEAFTKKIILMVKDGGLPIHTPYKSEKVNRKAFTVYSNSTPYGIAESYQQNS